MDLNYINPFIQAATDIIKEVTGIEVKKDEVYVRKGRKSQNGVGVILDVFKDVSGRIIFDFTSDMTKALATEMIGINLSNEEEMISNKEMLESAIKELGNMISGLAITLLEEKKYNCDINPPVVYLGRDVVLADSDHICIIIDFTSSAGNFSLCLTNRSDTYMETVTFLLYDINEYIEDALVFSFLPKGFEMFEVHDKNNLFKILSVKDIDFLLINTDKMANNLETELKTLKGRSKTQNTRIIAYTSKKDLSIFEPLFDEIVSFVLPSYFSDIEQVEAVKKFMEASGIRHSERRKHVRVDLKESDFAKVTFSIGDGQLLEGKILNLSIGGALFQCNDGKNLEKLFIGKKIEGMQLSIGGRIVRASSVIVYRKDFYTAIRFIDLKDSFLKAISKYIFKKLSNTADSM